MDLPWSLRSLQFLGHKKTNSSESFFVVVNGEPLSYKSKRALPNYKLQNRAARIITRADYSIRSSDVLNSLEWSNLEERRKRHLLVTMFKIFNNDCPTYLRERFHRTSEIHDYNLRGSNYDLQLPLPKTNFLKRSFSYRGAMAWNQLSNETREMGDLTSFKLAIS